MPASKPSKLGDVRITPDLSICDACQNEINDPHNRRFGYAFTTCTHCGPRFSILTGMPFDREHTAMSTFKMCAPCMQEYCSPQNSRHHVQTNSCSTCGITLKLFDSRSRKYVGTETDQEVIKIIGRHIMQGSIVAVKGIGGYLLICDATNNQTLIELRRRKQRPRKPLALMYPNIKAVRNDYWVSDQEESALQSSAAPIVLLQPKNEQHIVLTSYQINPGWSHASLCSTLRTNSPTRAMSSCSYQWKYTSITNCP